MAVRRPWLGTSTAPAGVSAMLVLLPRTPARPHTRPDPAQAATSMRDLRLLNKGACAQSEHRTDRVGGMQVEVGQSRAGWAGLGSVERF